jgi:hypothetical protein
VNLQEYLRKIGHLEALYIGVLKVMGLFGTTLRVDTTTPITKLCTYEINYFVNKHDFQFEDTLRVSLFSYEYGVPVYSDPPTFDVAKLNPNGFGYIPDPDWEHWFNYNGVNPDIIKKVKDVLANKPPVNYA